MKLYNLLKNNIKGVKFMEYNTNNGYVPQVEPKSKLVTLLLCYLLGGWGIDRFNQSDRLPQENEEKRPETLHLPRDKLSPGRDVDRFWEI